MELIRYIDLLDSQAERNANSDIADIMSSYRGYFSLLLEIKQLPTIPQKYAGYQKLLAVINQDYHPTLFSRWVRDLAREIAIMMDFWEETPPYKSLVISDGGERAKDLALAKLFNLYKEVKGQVAQYALLLGIIEKEEQKDTETKKNDTKNDTTASSGTREIRTITIVETNLEEIMPLKNDEKIKESNGELNNIIRDYAKMARTFMEMKSLQDKLGHMRELLKLMETTHGQYLNKEVQVNWKYTIANNRTNSKYDFTGAPDFETYNMAYNNPAASLKLTEFLRKEPYLSKKLPEAIVKMQVLYAAIKTEIALTEKEISCQMGLASGKAGPNGYVHFSKRVPDDELEMIYENLMTAKMLTEDVGLRDFLYWHTGSGPRPQEPLKWKTKNVCRYYVYKYLDADWKTAEQCFACVKGSIKGLSTASNITSKNKQIIDSIIALARG